MKTSWWLPTITAFLLLGAFALVPTILRILGEQFYVTLFSRVLVFALAAAGLNLLLGYGGLVSFGHSLYIAIGAYAVGIISSHGISSGWIQLLMGLSVGSLVAVPIGLVCLRTSGMAFIMITLAFAQMFYFVAVGLKQYGGDEGLSIADRSRFLPLDLSNSEALYYTVFATLLVVLVFTHRVVGARFGMALRGARMNDQRMRTLGFPILQYQLTAYVISALICVVAGMFLANLTRFVSPSYIHWSISGELIVMVVLGGMGTVIGPVIGATVLVLLEELLTGINLGLPWGGDEFIRNYWKAILGIFIISVTLLMKQGLYGALLDRAGRR